MKKNDSRIEVIIVSYLSHLECSACHKTYDPANLRNVCECGAPLLVRYDMERARKDPELFDPRYSGLWRYHKMLPLQDMKYMVTLGEGNTPVLEMPEEAEYIGLDQLLVKDEGQNPSSSFKTRGAAVSISRLRELGATDIIMDSGGNGAGAWAAYCKRGGVQAHIYMTAKAVQANKKECGFIGGDINMCTGHTSVLGQKVSETIKDHSDWVDTRTMREPYRTEGKKTIGYELAEQLHGEMPDVILFPTAGGVGIIGIHKAVEELMELGIVHKMPKFVSVQYEGCCPVVRAFESGAACCETWSGEMDVIPGGLSAPKAFADRLLLKILRETGGTAVAVSKEDTRRHWKYISEHEGFFTNPEGATTLAACEKLRRSGWLSGREKVLCVMTSNGIKYADLVEETPNTI